MALVACPFCRELFGAEEAVRCPHCDIPLVSLASLPPSAEALAEQPEESPLDRDLGFFYLGASRGLSLAGNALGLVFFFLPWFSLERPDPVPLSGFDLARGNAPWLFGGAIGFLLNLPLLLSRRTLRELDSIRGIAMTFALMTICEVIVLIAKPPLESSFFRVRLEFGFSLLASAAISLFAAFACFRLGKAAASVNPKRGGRASEASPTAREARAPGETPEDAAPKSKGRVLH